MHPQQLDCKWETMEGTKQLESQEVSESGWTMYLGQSIDCDDSYANSLIEFEEDQEKAGMEIGHGWYQQKCEDDDSSMASDASSGPAQPLEAAAAAHDTQHGSGCDDKSTLFYMRKPKFRRMEADEQQDLYLLEDTASSPVCSFKSSLTENEAEIKDFLDVSKFLSESHDATADAVNKRLEVLQSILPGTPVKKVVHYCVHFYISLLRIQSNGLDLAKFIQRIKEAYNFFFPSSVNIPTKCLFLFIFLYGMQICREETLGLAMKYINLLEQRIKEFEGKDESKNINVGVSARGNNVDGEVGVLRERGLCLVPISTLWSAT